MRRRSSPTATPCGRLSAYLQVESIGSDGPALLFETGPANGWLVEPWARHAPHPRGASYAVEIYKHLPNDTDFSILERQEIPGLNFAPVGDSYAYHTARDTPERLSPRTIRDTGENVVAILGALIRPTSRSAHLTPARTSMSAEPRLVYGAGPAGSSRSRRLVFGVVAWVRVTAAALHIGGLFRWLLTAVWSALGVRRVRVDDAATWGLGKAARSTTPGTRPRTDCSPCCWWSGARRLDHQPGRPLAAGAGARLRHPLVAWSWPADLDCAAWPGCSWRRRPPISGACHCSPPASRSRWCAASDRRSAPPLSWCWRWRQPLAA